MVAKDLPKVVLYFRNSFSEIQFSYHTARLFKVYIPCLYIQHAELSSITPQKSPIPFSTHSHPPYFQPKAVTHLLSVSIDLLMLNISNIWNY